MIDRESEAYSNKLGLKNKFIIFMIKYQRTRAGGVVQLGIYLVILLLTILELQ